MSKPGETMNRPEYVRQMDELHIPEEKAKETLQKMLAENRRLRETQAKAGAGGKPAFRWQIPAAVLTAAACLVLLVVGLSGRGGAYTFESIRLSSLPQGGARGGGTQVLSFEETFGCAPETLFLGGTVTEGKAGTQTLNGVTRRLGNLTIEANGKTLDVSVTGDAPPLYTALLARQTVNGASVVLAQDPDTGIRYCAYERAGLYIVLSSGELSGEDFISALRTVVKPA